MTQKFPNLVIYAHWTTLLLVLLAYFTSKSPIQDQWMGQIHVIAGSFVFLFFFIRITLYFTYRTQFPIVPNMTKFQGKAFQCMKICLYFCLFMVPCLGWFALSETHMNFSIWGMDVPLLTLSKNYDLGIVHQFVANTFITLVGLHAIAALFHHFILKDDVLRSMK